MGLDFPLALILSEAFVSDFAFSRKRKRPAIDAIHVEFLTKNRRSIFVFDRLTRYLIVLKNEIINGSLVI